MSVKGGNHVGTPLPRDRQENNINLLKPTGFVHQQV